MPLQPSPAATDRPLTPLRADALAVTHGFFGRAGGVSTGIYASLNAGPGSKDDPQTVAENRRRIAAHFGLTPEYLVGVHQIHSPHCVAIDAPWRGPRAEADALMTTTPGLALSIVTADCAPVLFADTQAGVIAAAHAGWKGAITGVLQATLGAMEEAGAQRSRIVAAIGPCIHQKSYEVGPEFEARFLEADAANAQFFAPGAGDRRRFDLPGFCAAQLTGLARVEILPHDTCAEAAAFFSNRRATHAADGDYGRNLSAIVLPA